MSTLNSNIHHVKSIKVEPSELLDGRSDSTNKTCTRKVIITTLDGLKYSITAFNSEGPVPLVLGGGE